nr:MAG TPA: hypothetical protein [Caudoviricetes sp.]
MCSTKRQTYGILIGTLTGKKEDQNNFLRVHLRKT